jgi:hypothetical protein
MHTRYHRPHEDDAMNTRWLMRASAIYIALIGIAGTFMPQEILRLAGVEAAPMLTLGLQVAAAAHLGFAVLNWTAQGVLIGGIYARPLALGNFTHFLVSGLALIKAAASGLHAPPVLIAAAIHAIFGGLYAFVAFGNPLPAKPARDA